LNINRGPAVYQGAWTCAMMLVVVFCAIATAAVFMPASSAVAGHAAHLAGLHPADASAVSTDGHRAQQAGIRHAEAVAEPVSDARTTTAHCPITLSETHCDACNVKDALPLSAKRERNDEDQDDTGRSWLVSVGLKGEILKLFRQSRPRAPPGSQRVDRRARPDRIFHRFRI